MKHFLIICLVLIISSYLYTSEYTVPRAAYSVYVEDLDLDGDKDIVVGHNYNVQTGWSGVSIIQNDGYGVFTLIDSVFLYGWQNFTLVINLDSLSHPEIIAKFYDSQEDNEYIAIINNNNFSDISYYSLYTNEGIDYITCGDIENDNDTDIIIASNTGQFWGVLYNTGNGQFSTPDYYNLDYHPGNIACADLNNDGRDDVVVCGLKLEAYISYPDSFLSVLVDEPNYMANVKIADMNNDSINDIVTETWYMPGTSKDISIYFNDGNLNFNYVYVKTVQEAAAEIYTAKLNTDNYTDVIYNVSYYYPNSTYETYHTYIMFNKSDSTLFNPVAKRTYNGSQIGYVQSINSVTGDLDNNGWQDIVTVNYSPNESSVHILFNDGTGNFIEDPVSIILENKEKSPNLFELYPNYPNPFNPSATISYALPKHSKVVIVIYDAIGKKIKTLLSDNTDAGSHHTIWDGTNQYGQQVASGVYFYTFKAKALDGSKETYMKSSKLLLLR